MIYLSFSAIYREETEVENEMQILLLFHLTGIYSRFSERNSKENANNEAMITTIETSDVHRLS